MSLFGKNFHSIIKALGAAVVFFCLFFLGGVWRLVEAPLRLPVHFDPIRQSIREYGVTFDEIYLFAPSLWSLPGIYVQNGRYENDAFALECPKAYFFWKVHSLFLLPRIKKIDEIFLDNPLLTLKPSSQHNSSSLTADLLNFLPETLTIKKGRVAGKVKEIPFPAHLIDATLSQDASQIKIQWDARVMPGSHETRVEGEVSLVERSTVDGRIIIKELIPQEWELFVPAPYKETISFLNHPFPLLSITLKGNIEEASSDLHTLVKIEAPFLFEDKMKNLPITGNLSLHSFSLWETIKGSFEIKTDSFPWQALHSLWPPSLSPTVREWCIDRIQGGKGHPISLKGEFSSTLDQGITLHALEGTLGVFETTVQYMDTLPSVEGAEALATFTKDNFIITITQGKTKNLTVQKGVVRFDHLQTEDPHGLIDLQIQGPLREALWVADHPPLSFASEYGFNPSSVSGNSLTRLVLAFSTRVEPSLKTIRTTLQSNIEDFSLDRSLMDQALHLRKGMFNLTINPQRLTLKGNAWLNGTPCTIAWTEAMTEKAPLASHYLLKGMFPLKTLMNFMPQIIQDSLKKGDIISLKGNPILTLDYKKNKDSSALRLSLDLHKTSLSLPFFQYMKDDRTPGGLDLTLHFKGEHLEKIDPLTLVSHNLFIQGQSVFHKDGTLKILTLSDFSVNKFQLKATLQKEKNNMWHLDLLGSTLDLPTLLDFYKNRPQAETAQEKEDQPPFKITGKFDKVLLKNNMRLSMLTASLLWEEKGRQTYMLQCGEANKKTLDLTYKKSSNQETLSLHTSLLNYILQGLDLTHSLSVEHVSLEATHPLDAPTSPYKGLLQVQGLRVKDAPMMAKLFSLVSIEGILSTLKGDGILFMKGNAHFEYLNKKIAIQQMELTSSFLGLTGKGYVDILEDKVDIEGYIIPANLLNQLIGSIPIIGSILSGNSTQHKGLVSISYTMKGPWSDPVVSSNPLSVLAPNIIKGLFSNLTGEGKEVPTLQGDTASKKKS